MVYYPRAIVIEQGGSYFAVGENGRNFCEPNQDLGMLAAALAKAAQGCVNGRMTRGSLEESSGVEVFFKDGNEQVLFLTKKDHGTGKILRYLCGKEPTQGKAKIFYDAFCNVQRQMNFEGIF